jgi:hypothetical protein
MELVKVSPTPLHPAGNLERALDDMRQSAAAWRDEGPWLSRPAQDLICLALDLLFATILSILAQIRDGTLVLPNPRAPAPEPAADPRAEAAGPDAVEAETRPAARTRPRAASRDLRRAGEIEAWSAIEADPQAEDPCIVPPRPIARPARAATDCPPTPIFTRPSSAATSGGFVHRRRFFEKSIFAARHFHDSIVPDSKHLAATLRSTASTAGIRPIAPLD